MRKMGENNQNTLELEEDASQESSEIIFELIDQQPKRKRCRKQIEPWSKDKVLELVAAVEQRECVWNHLNQNTKTAINEN